MSPSFVMGYMTAQIQQMSFIAMPHAIQKQNFSAVSLHTVCMHLGDVMGRYVVGYKSPIHTANVPEPLL